MAGMDEMDSVRAGLDLWCLAVKVREFPEVEEVIVSSDNWLIVREKIVGVPGGDQFLHNWDEFMMEHGHHCYGEMEMFNPRWCETPNYILFLVRGYITGGDEADPIEKRHDRAQQRKQLVQQSRERLINPIKRFIFNYFLDRAMRGAALRENWKSEGVRYMTLFRRSLMELDQRLNNRGVLENQDDIFFLKLEELEPVAQNKADFDFKKIIVQRRAEYEKNKSVTPPKVVIGKFDHDDYTPDAVDTNAEVLNGLAVSSGVVTGKARVILRADTDEQVLPGEILVAPFTDPGWTPCFVPAAAIVMDQGGLLSQLSHGSIIAREYGIPAVVNVGPATKIIKTGQTIQVDANRGVVRILR
jgi:pyruvate,water dikinase